MTDRVPAGSDGGAPDKALVIVGRIRKPQGLHGEFLVEPITDAPDAIFASGRRVYLGTADAEPDRNGTTLTVTRARAFKDGYIVGFAEVRDRTSAEGWRGRYLLVPGSELPELEADEIYRHDLLGMRVTDETHGELGTVSELYDLPQGLTLEVRGSRAAILLPYRPEIVREVDLDERVIRVATPPGLID